MIKILNAQQIKELDRYTIQHEPIASIDLMERACKAFCSWFTQKFDPGNKIGIVCGTGNNGGDGLGVARMLHKWDYDVKVWVVRGGVGESDDFKTNFARLPEAIVRQDIQTEVDSTTFQDCNVLVDAIFGSGLSRSTEGIYASVINAINQTSCIRVSIDIPSGLFADKNSQGSVVRAYHTISLQLPKLAFLLAENAQYVGSWYCVDIGLSKAGLSKIDTPNFLLTRKWMKSLVKPLNKFDHKGNRGRALLIAGSFGKMGAAVLAARAVLRTGIGLLTVHIPKNGYSIIQTAVPEAMTIVDESDNCFTGAPELGSYDAVGIGPGIGQDMKTTKALAGLLEKIGRPVVLDADAINIVASNRALIHSIPRNSILTPHPREFERLAGPWKNDFEKIELLRSFAKSNNVVVALKGAHTSIAAPDGTIYFNNTGNPGMATGGTGDVLTGVCTALLAQGYNSLESAQLGVWLHGLAGDEAARKQGLNGMIASDLIDNIPAAYTNLT